MTDFVLGIDPGATGALALYNCHEAIFKFVMDMPHDKITLTTGKNTNRVNIKELINIFDFVISNLNLEDDTDTLHVHIEKVQAFGKQSAPAAFNFGYAASIPFTIAKCFGYEPVMIPPQTWKRQYNLQASEKDEARLLALSLFPACDEILKLKKYIDRADAMLIACYKPN